MKYFYLYKYFLYILLSIFLITCNPSYKNNDYIFRCGADELENAPISAKNIFPIENSNYNYKRNLDNVDQDGFKEFKIYLDLLNFDYEVELYNLQDKKDLFKQGMEKAINTLKSLLKVKPSQKDYYFTDEQIISLSIQKWDNSKIGNNAKSEEKGFFENDIDLYIFARFGNNSEMGESTLASAGARFLDQDTGRPLIGVVNINKDVDYSKTNSQQYFEGIIIHEFTHILGFSNHFFKDIFKNILIKEDEFGIQRAYINSSKVLQVAKKYFNCDSIEGVELEEFGGEGTVGSHWEARILLGEYMNGVVYTPEQVISEFTLALLEDSGYYKPNYYTGGLMQFGKNKGCNFLKKKCIDNGKVDSKFTNEFFDYIYSDLGNYDTSCSSGRQSRAYHIFFKYNSVPEKYQYFSNDFQKGGWQPADYCPISVQNNNEGNNGYYIGHCSQKGSGEYGSMIQYIINENNIRNYKSGEILGKTGEKLSENSFCVLSSLISLDVEDHNLYSNTIRAVCYQMHCSDRSLTIQINNDYIVCPRAGGKISALNYEGYLSCPDYNLICSGTVLCNDMFDCVEKKSLLKDVTYDYEVKTTQDLSIIEEEEISLDSYELSTNGKCPQYCSQCNESGQCIKCKNEYGIVEINELNKNGLNKRECNLLTELNIGYYKIGEIYYKCTLENCQQCISKNECKTCELGYTVNNNICISTIKQCINYEEDTKCKECANGYELIENGNKCILENCLELNEDDTCKTCKDNYRLSNNKCYKKIDNCNEYEIDEKCKKCEDGYAFKENDRLNCKNKIDFLEYYSKDNELSYFKCDGEEEEEIERIRNCKKCEYEDSNNKLKCNICQNNYIIKDDETSKCYYKEDYLSNNSYYLENEYHIKKCSSKINNCEKCEKQQDNEIICQKCKDNYFFIDEDYKNCWQSEQITPKDEFYYDSENKQYFSCEKHSIENCKKCDNSNYCKICIYGYALLDEDKTFCKKIDEIGNDYTKDDDQGLFYKKCNNYIINCNTCQSKDKCLSCIAPYVLYYDQKNCLDNNNLNYYKNSSDNLYYPCRNIIKNCEECQSESQCEKCEEGFKLVNNKCFLIIEKCEIYDENNGNCNNCINGYEVEIIEDKTNCKIKYSNCIQVNDEGKCTKCENNYILLDDKLCYKIIEKCEIYNYENCQKCKEGYAFEEDERKICKNKDEFEEYYSKDGISYLKCDGVGEGRIQNCKKCDYENNANELICVECKDDYLLIDEEKNICYLKEQYINNKRYFLKDSFHLRTCSKKINKCEECEKINENIICEKCEDDYSLVNENNEKKMYENR